VLAVAIGMAEWNASKGIVQVGVGYGFSGAAFLGYALLLAAVEEEDC
jgi:hypothetical protein